jgi:starch synthase
VFSNSKVIFTIGQNTFEEKLGADFLKRAVINANIKEKDLDAFKDANNTSLFKGGATHADAITFGADTIEKKLTDEFTKVKGKKVVPFKGWDSDLTEYLELYNDLASK